VIYLVQHGEAKSKEEDPDRPLTDEGRATVQRVAAWAAKAGVQVGQIRHSGKRRAEQTAAIFADALKPDESVTAYPGLGPKDGVEPVAEALASCPCAVMVVGHLPFLSRLASYLVTGDPETPIVRFRYGGLVGLAQDEQKWTLACLVPPELAG
jgi:phosphohistidine phosphatase